MDLIYLFYFIFSDPEGDQIAFSTDEELVEALGFVEDGVFRIKIKGKMVRLTDTDKENKSWIN